MPKRSREGPRTRKLTYWQKKKAAKIKIKKRPKLPGSFQLIRQAISIIRKHWKPLGGIMLVYLILNIVFASGISNLGSTISQIKDNFESNGKFWSALSGFGALVASAGSSSSPTASILQSALIIIVSLAIIWSLRQLLAGSSIRVKQAYYQSMFPLIPFLLVLTVIFIQLLPLTLLFPVVSMVLSTIINSEGLLITLLLIFFTLMAVWSFYMISSSLFAIYIVTLPNMQPRQALRSAKNLVRFRRWQLMRRIFFLPIFIVVIMAVFIVPLIIVASFLVVPFFYILSSLAILFAHTYLYSLYRSLIR
jgi:hypothetical protein